MRSPWRFLADLTSRRTKDTAPFDAPRVTVGESPMEKIEARPAGKFLEAPDHSDINDSAEARSVHLSTVSDSAAEIDDFAPSVERRDNPKGRPKNQTVHPGNAWPGYSRSAVRQKTQSDCPHNRCGIEGTALTDDQLATQKTKANCRRRSKCRRQQSGVRRPGFDGPRALYCRDGEPRRRNQATETYDGRQAFSPKWTIEENARTL